MACSSGNSITSSDFQKSSSSSDAGETQQPVMKLDERKRKRMESNRESARRSRMRKQKHLDDLISQADQIKKENHAILQTINVTTQQFANVEAENSVLKAQMNELSQRLQSLNDILDYMNTLNGPTTTTTTTTTPAVEVEDSFDFVGCDFGFNQGYFGHNNDDNIVGNNPWDLVYLNHPIMATADVLQY